MRFPKPGGILVLAALVSLICACGPIRSVTIGHRGHHHEASHPHHERGYGPPPHAPAHGYRHKQKRANGADLELVFDSEMGVYVVVDIPDRYYWDGHYLRFEDGRWSASVDLDGGWESRSDDSLPPGLRKKVTAKHGKPSKARKKHESHGAAKGDW